MFTECVYVCIGVYSLHKGSEGWVASQGQPGSSSSSFSSLPGDAAEPKECVNTVQFVI